MSDKIQSNLRKRNRSEKIFKFCGFFAIALSLLFLVILFTAVIFKGHSAFISHKVVLTIDLSMQNLGLSENAKIDQEALDVVNYRFLVKRALLDQFPQVVTVQEKNMLYGLVSKISALELKNNIKQNPDLIGTKAVFSLSMSSNADMYLKGKILESTPSELRKIKDRQIIWIKELQAAGKIKTGFNRNFFSQADSREPEIAGMAASLVGSLLTMMVFLICAFPIGVMSALYLEELAPKNIFTDIIEISINNLAAIPSIIFGLLGLVVYLNFLSLPRSSSIVGGLTLFLLVLPIIIITTRNAIRSIPPSIKNAAIALGASRMQVVFHHTFPLALPGIMTGTILAVSRALGETAPLLMIGMVAFIVDVPEGFFDPTTVIPVQIYLWSDSPELGFAEKTAAAIMVLLALLIVFNGIAVFLRKKFEKKW